MSSRDPGVKPQGWATPLMEELQGVLARLFTPLPSPPQGSPSWLQQQIQSVITPRIDQAGQWLEEMLPLAHPEQPSGLGLLAALMGIGQDPLSILGGPAGGASQAMSIFGSTERLPPVAKGFVRLYRGQVVDPKQIYHGYEMAGRSFTTYLPQAEEYARTAAREGESAVFYLDVPVEVAKKHLHTFEDTGDMVGHLPREWAKKMQRLPPSKELGIGSTVTYRGATGRHGGYIWSGNQGQVLEIDGDMVLVKFPEGEQWISTEEITR